MRETPPQPQPHTLTLCLCADPALIGADGSAKALERRAAALCALAALEPGISRARAAALLWPDSDDARRALRQQLSRFKKTLGLELIEGGDALRITAGIAVDLSSARGLLAGLAFEDCEEFDAWLTGQRARRRGAATAELAQLLAQAEASRDYDAALKLAEQLVAADADSETHHRNLIRLHYLNGDVAQAQATYARLETMLRVRYAARPSDETEQLARALRSNTLARPAAPRAIPVTVQRPPRLVGRADELGALDAAWQARSGAIVLGEGGMGKTRLISDLAHAHGHALQAVARPGDASLPYAVATRLVRTVVRTLRAPPAPGIARELARLLPELGEAPPLASDVDRARFLGAVDALLAQAAGEGAQGLILDDLHYADAASLEALRHAAAAELGLAWIVALRPTETGSDAQTLLDTLMKIPGSMQIVLAPLTEADVAELLASLDLGLPDTDALVAQITRRAGGNPLFVLETIKSLWLHRENGTVAATALSGNTSASLLPLLPSAPNVASLITRRLARLSTHALDLARCAAVAGQDFNAELAAATLAVRAIDLADTWVELEAAQIFRDGGFAHDLIYEAALASVPQPVAAAMHASIATWLAARDGAPARIAHHFDRAGRSGQAAPYWMGAGNAAQSALRFAEATDAFERAAFGHGTSGQNKAAFEAAYAMRLASFEVDLDQRSAAALDLLEKFAATPVQQARAHNERAVTRLHQGDLPGTEAAARAGLAALDGADEPLLRAELRRNVAAVHVWRNETRAALAELRAIEHDILRLGPPRLRAEFHQSIAIVLDHVDDIAASKDAHERGIELMLATGNVPGAAQTALNLAVGEHDAGDVRAARATLERARLLLAAVPEQRRSYSSLELNYGFVLCGLGEYEAALRHLDQAIENCRVQTPGWLPLMAAYRAQLWLHLGQPARAQQDLAAAPPDQNSPAAARSKWAVAQAQLAAATRGRDREALARLDGVVSALPEQGRRLSRWRPQLARVLHLDDEDAISLARAVRFEVSAVGRAGIEVTAGALLAERLMRLSRADEALPIALRTLTLLEDHAPDNHYRGDVWAQCLPVLRAADFEERYRAELARAVSWIEETAARHVPAEFRESFVERNPANRELRRAATRNRAQ